MDVQAFEREEWFVVWRASGGDCPVLYCLEQIFQGLPGLVSSVVPILLLIL